MLRFHPCRCFLCHGSSSFDYRPLCPEPLWSSEMITPFLIDFMGLPDRVEGTELIDQISTNLVTSFLVCTFDLIGMLLGSFHCKGLFINIVVIPIIKTRLSAGPQVFIMGISFSISLYWQRVLVVHEHSCASCLWCWKYMSWTKIWPKYVCFLPVYEISSHCL